MANFKTHLAVAAAVSCGAAGVLAGLGTVNYVQAALLALLGVFGGILPDIDSDKSSAITIVFNLTASMITFLVFLMTYWAYDVFVSLIACLATFVVVRFPVQWIFAKFTIHRGAFHSVLATAMMGLIFTVGANFVLGADSILSWYTGLFVCLGYLVHLLLDEIYSVDFSNAKIKRSFGSAMKPVSLKYPISSLSFIVIVGGLYYIAPETDKFIETIL